MASTKSALETTELLELILLHLPLRSVLRVQAVSHLWRATILTSIKLQQALFLRPLPQPSTTERFMQDVSLNDTCIDALSTPTPRTRINDILGLAGSASSISRLPATPTSKAMTHTTASWRTLHLTQPPTPSDFLVGNFIALSATEAVGLPKDQFVPLESTHSTTRTYGSFSRLGAIQLECPSGLTLEMAAQGIAQLNERFASAEHKGRQLRFFWGSQVKADLMVDLLEEIAQCVEEDVRVMRREARA